MKDHGNLGAEGQTAAERAVNYILNRMVRDRNAWRLFGPGTQTYELICIAEAERMGLHPLELRQKLVCFDDRQSEVEELRSRIESLEAELEEQAS